MGRKNRRNRCEYHTGLGFNPNKYVSRAGEARHQENSSHPIVRGAICFAELGNHTGTSVQGGCRPVLVVSNNANNRYSATYNVLPMTTRIKRADMPSHVLVEEKDVNNRDLNRKFETSMVLAEQITTISESAVCSYIGTITEEQKLAEIQKAVMCQLGL